MAEKKKKLKEKLSIEDLYQNKNFVKPKEKNLETIFEEPRKAKNGSPMLTSTKKFKRYLHFDPTENKIHKRKLKIKKMKCVNKMRFGKRTRSTPKKKLVCDDISSYILQVMGESSDSEVEQTSTEVTDTCKPRDSKVDGIKQPHTSVDDDDCKTVQNPDNILSDFGMKKVNDSRDGEADSEQCEKTETAVAEETEAKEPSRSSCVVA